MNQNYMQDAIGIMTYPTGKWQRWVFKAPLKLWRLGLGPLIGRVLLVLSHTGRKTGLPRHTMVEFHRLNGQIYAPCAFGPKADWYKNIMADPRVTIQTAYGTESVIARRVTEDEEILAVFELFKRRDPPLLYWYLQSLNINPEKSDILAKKDRIYWLRFDPTEDRTPPPLEADLIWLWPIIVIAQLIILLTMRSRRH